MLKVIECKGLVDRKTRVAENEALGLRMIQDNFNPGWKRGQEPSGALVFTDEQPALIDPPRNLSAEVDEIKATLRAIENSNAV